MSPLATIAIGFAGGVASWFATSFIGEPIQHLRLLRRSASAKLIDLGRAGPPPKLLSEEDQAAHWDLVERSSAEIRKAAVDLIVFAATQPTITAIAKWFGYDVQTAGTNLLGFSDQMYRGWGKDRDEYSDGFRKAMKLAPKKT